MNNRTFETQKRYKKKTKVDFSEAGSKQHLNGSGSHPARDVNGEFLACYCIHVFVVYR